MPIPPLNDLACAIDECSVELTITRFLSPGMRKGRLTSEPTEQTFVILGSFQPVTGREMQRLPEGMRTQRRAKIYTTEKLKTVDNSEMRIPDKVSYRNATYTVDKVEDWADLGNYYRVEVVELGQ